MPRPDSYRTQIPAQCCGLCKHAENINAGGMEAILCFHGDNVEISRITFPGDFFPTTHAILDGVDLVDMEAEDFGHVWMDRLVCFHDTCDQWERAQDDRPKV
jgi:hypothetical protein